jgi:hypothetical protein
MLGPGDVAPFGARVVFIGAAKSDGGGFGGFGGFMLHLTLELSGMCVKMTVIRVGL